MSNPARVALTMPQRLDTVDYAPSAFPPATLYRPVYVADTHTLLLEDLRRHLRALLHNEASISASVYDTATALRLTPPSTVQPALQWLLQMQAADGGWGDLHIDPRARTVPTLSSLLALHQYRNRVNRADVYIKSGLEWMNRTVEVWESELPDDLPVGVELILPHLLRTAAWYNLPLQGTYAPIRALGAKRQQRLAAIPYEHKIRTTALHSWESWGSESDPALWHPVNGIACSPAATAAWAADVADPQLRLAAQQYLERASAATEVNCFGVVPTAFPITRFMQSYSLHTLTLANLLHHPALTDTIAPLMADLHQAMTPEGIGNNDDFIADGDDTAAALGSLHTWGYPVDPAILLRFAQQDHVVSYHGELQPSVITTARAAIALEQMGLPVGAYQQWIAQRQHANGSWQSDKWNGVWLYSTLLAIIALRSNDAYREHLQRAHDAIIRSQQSDGGWGTPYSSPEATAYALLALTALPWRSGVSVAAIRSGARRLQADYRPLAVTAERHWLAKERYSALRLSAIVIVTALLATLD